MRFYRRVTGNLLRYKRLSNGIEALGRARSEAFDLIVMDVRMPEMDGMETCRQLRTLPEGSRLKIVACTAHAGDGDRKEFLENGFNEVLTKPFLVEELLAALAKTESASAG